MNRSKKIIQIVLSAVFLLCVFFDAWEFAPALKKFFDITEAVCFIIVIGILIQSKMSKNKDENLIKTEPSLYDRYWKFYSFLLRVVARLFILWGIIILPFAVQEMMDRSKPTNRSDGLEGIGMCLGGIILGFLILKVGKMKD
ncbi:MAG: hypothetical protein JWR19_1507 [Pedosphaera sp.]|jgi:hypothetical protein|nr:hypothetical protein [Pedosphaera sp.]